jgi:hypothetical protein
MSIKGESWNRQRSLELVGYLLWIRQVTVDQFVQCGC